MDLFYGGTPPKSVGKNKGFCWVQTHLVRESGPWYSPIIKTPEDATELVSLVNQHLDLEDADREKFIAIFLDRKGKVNAAEIVSIGGLSSSIAHPREVFKAALLASAASVILVHNHPSGDPSPSNEDIALTKRMKEAGEILGVEVLDHIIIGTGNFVSLLARGLM